MLIYIKKLLIISLATICISCSNSNNIPIIPEAKMKAIIADMVRAEEFVTIYVVKDSIKKLKPEMMKYYNKVFAIHHTNSKQFLNSFDYYLKNPLNARNMFDSLATQLRQEQFKPVVKEL